MLDLGLGEPGLIDVDGVRVSPRSVFKKVLDNRLTFGEPDVVLVRIVTEGVVGDRRRRQVSEIIDYYDRRTGLTAMMRCTAFPAAIIAAMAASGKIAARGVMAQETAVDPDFFERELAARKINVSRRWMK
jgi:lysine 6-dehydrogenase